MRQLVKAEVLWEELVRSPDLYYDNRLNKVKGGRDDKGWQQGEQGGEMRGTMALVMML